VKFFRVGDVDGQLHAVTEADHEPLCRQGVQMLFPEDLTGAFSSTHRSACPACVAAVETIRGDPEESYVDEYNTQVTAPPGEVAPSEPDDTQPADA
jgi:hypothetical protein